MPSKFRNFVFDRLIIPQLTLFFILLTCLFNIVLYCEKVCLGHSWELQGFKLHSTDPFGSKPNRNPRLIKKNSHRFHITRLLRGAVIDNSNWIQFVEGSMVPVVYWAAPVTREACVIRWPENASAVLDGLDPSADKVFSTSSLWLMQFIQRHKNDFSHYIIDDNLWLLINGW